MTAAASKNHHGAGRWSDQKRPQVKPTLGTEIRLLPAYSIT
jgi:hypothetical protein